MARYKVNAAALPWAPGQVITESDLSPDELARLLKEKALTQIGGSAEQEPTKAGRKRK